LVEDLKRLGLWSMDMLEKIKYHDGSIQEIMEIPPAIRDKYKEVFEIEPQWLVKAAAHRGRWIDQSQSLNIFYGGTSGKVLSEIYMYAWSLGLKTTYYLRTMGASRIEKSTVNMQKFGGTSKSDTSVASNAGSTPSSVTIEETVMVATRGVIDQAPSPIQISMSEKSDVIIDHMAYAKIAALPRQESSMESVHMTHPAPPILKPMSSGIPKFGEQSTAVKNRPKIEIIGEQCESCSA
jgi:ribonucleotide reductase alpha subunit